MNRFYFHINCFRVLFPIINNNKCYYTERKSLEKPKGANKGKPMLMLLFSLTPHLLIEQNHLPNEYKYYLVNNVDLFQKPCWCPKYRILLKKKFLVYNACQTFIFSSKQFCWSLGANLRLFRMLKRTVVWFLRYQ